MVLPGHLSGGYLITRAILHFFATGLSATQATILLVLGTLTGELPDIDLVIHYISQKLSPKNSPTSHREYLTHTPIAWLGFSIILFLIGLLFGSLFIKILAVLILCGTWCHFLFDSIEYGVMWLWPFSKKYYALVKILPEAKVTAPLGSALAHYQFLRTAYFKTWTFWAEAIVTLVAILVLIATIH